MKRILTIIGCTVLFFIASCFIFMFYWTQRDDYGYEIEMPQEPVYNFIEPESFDRNGNLVVLTSNQHGNNIYSMYSVGNSDDYKKEVESQNANSFLIDDYSFYNDERLESQSGNAFRLVIFNDKFISDFDNYSSYEEANDSIYRYYEKPETLENLDVETNFYRGEIKFKDEYVTDKDLIDRACTSVNNYFISEEKYEEMFETYVSENGEKLILYPHPLFDKAYLVKVPSGLGFAPAWSFVGFKKLDTPIEYYDLDASKNIINNETRGEFKKTYEYQVFGFQVEYRMDNFNVLGKIMFTENDKRLYMDEKEFKSLVDNITIKK